MIGHWIPPNERSNFVTAYMGASFGIWAFFSLFGYIILWFSWEWIFHLCAIVGTIWFVIWMAYVYDSPSQHPYIKSDEKNYIEHSLHGLINKNQNKVLSQAFLSLAKTLLFQYYAHCTIKFLHFK